MAGIPVRSHHLSGLSEGQRLRVNSVTTTNTSIETMWPPLSSQLKRNAGSTDLDSLKVRAGILGIFPLETGLSDLTQSSGWNPDLIRTTGVILARSRIAR